MTDTNDDHMDQMLIQGVRDYNLPGAVPREEMWKRIEGARREARDARRETRGAIRVWLPLAVAAALILSVGIVIGRRMDRAEVSKAPIVAVNPTPTPVAPSPRVDSTKKDDLIKQLQTETQKTDRRARELASNEPAAASRPAPRSSRLDETNQNLAMRLVTLQHLAGAEAMITSFRMTARSGAVDAQIGKWARELLSTTRLLESSSQISDPMMKRLLEDLDLVISQIVQYTATGTTNTEELDLIEQSINKRGVMSKLRSNSGRGVTAGT